MKNKLFQFRTWLNNVPVKDPVNRHMAALLQVMLIGFMAIVLVAFILSFIPAPASVPLQAAVIRGLIFSVVIGTPFLLLRRGHFRSSVLVIIFIFFALETFAILTAGLHEIAETLAFFTLAIMLAGLLINQIWLLWTYLISAGVVSLAAYLEQQAGLTEDGIAIAINFILIHGLMSLFLSQFGITLRTALNNSLEREKELRNEVDVRRQAEATLQQTTDRLEMLHEIDRSLLSARSPHEIARAATVRIRKLIPCPRASVTLIDLDKNEAKFLAADFENLKPIEDTPISLEEFGLNIIDELRLNKPWSTSEVLKDPQVTDLSRRLAEEDGIHSWLCLPIIYQGHLIGSLNLGRGIGTSFTLDESIIAHDVANQLAIAIQHINLYNTLQSELTARKKLIAELEANNAELERFTYTVSHDLRNPLVTIKGFLGMLEKDLEDGRKDRIASDFQRIGNAADKMDELLSDLLELSRIGRVINPPEEVDFGKLTREAVELLDARIRSKNVTVKLSPDLPTISGDRIRLREVIENLIDNAVKYTDAQETPVIEIGAGKQNDDHLIFVSDNGMGIEVQHLKKIFGLFEKLDQYSEGTGIGLALIKRIIETHGGKIWAESDGLGKGSTFYFTLPQNPK